MAPLIRAVETTVVDLPTIRPHRTKSDAIQRQSYVVVRLRTDDADGVGEAGPPGGPWWNGESAETCQAIIDRYLAPELVGMRVDQAPHVREKLGGRVRGNPFAKAAVETALLDAWARSLGASFGVFFGGRCRDTIPLRWALSADRSEAVRAEVEEKKAEGFTRFKLKMGALPPREDLERVRGIAKVIGHSASILVDPNGAWDEETARFCLPALAEAGVDLVEQPLPRSEVAATGRLRRTSRLGFIADESAADPKDVFALRDFAAADRVSVKIGKSGGPLQAARLAALVEAAGLRAYGGTALESSIGTAAALHLFASLPSLEECELVGPSLLTEDLGTPIRPEGGVLRVPTGPGLGLDIDFEKVRAYRRNERTSA